MNTPPLFQLNNKVAIVTGASKGIGLAIAHALAQFGAKVVVSSRDQKPVDEIAANLVSAGYDALAVAANTSNSEELAELVNKTMDYYGSIDIVVNNAATNPAFGAIENVATDAFDKIFKTNVKGPFELCTRALPSMRQRKGGSIINISSIAGVKPEPNLSVYSASKAALINMTQAMAQQWGKDNIRVNAVCPGLIKTKFSEVLWDDETTANTFLQRIALNRIGKPEELAGLAVFLASDAASYCSGGVYMVDGGYSVC